MAAAQSSSSSPPGKITAEMAKAPPFFPRFSAAPSLHQILGLHHLRQSCFLFPPLPLPLPPPSSLVMAKKGSWRWMTKEEAEKRRGLGFCRRSLRARSSCLEFGSRSPRLDGRTTVMIKNIPNKLSREMLFKLLDEHCAEQNMKLGSKSDLPLSEFDFVYLPIDFETGCGLGYAFVNFTAAAAARRFYAAMESYRWGLFETKKVGHVCYARIQGKEALLANFCGSTFWCDSDEYLPATFSPARNGAPPLPPPVVVGIRSPRFIPPPDAAAEAAEPDPETAS